MKFSLLHFAGLLGVANAWLDPIVIKGSKFYYSSNETQFFLRGVAYQQTASSTDLNDPLANPTACKRDIPYMQELRTNVIRTYSINTTADHSECMKLLAEAGIYVISDMSNSNDAIDRDDPTWETTLYSHYKEVVDELAQYNNTIGFFAGNEIMNSVGTTEAAPYVKAAVRDIKAYISDRGYRSMGVGYSTADVSSIREDLGDFMDCETKAQSIDFLGYNIYSWCGDSTYEESGYEARTKEFANYSVPVFFSEYGCNADPPRKFTEVKALYGETMSKVWSGGIVYEYFQETNDYGLVSVIDSTSVSTMTDFKYYSTSSHAPQKAVTGKRRHSLLPPSPDAELCECMYADSACVVSSSVDTDDYGTLMGLVCGYTSCDGITGNGTTGKYGSYSMCNVKQQLAFVLNQYYEDQDKAANACSFGGSATTKATTSPTGTCSKQMSEAGTAGTGTVTTEATATAGSSGSSGSSSSATATSTSVSLAGSSGASETSLLMALLASIGYNLL
ncbi:1-3-beta-glucanosyltransferase [Penicillium malachiteum]|uniref:1-3-beta-glucanosyltransferase n=1 Tax=Penicillium malachiteum TaxID=1324776 RepID=UPI0025487D7C|nr:1-3-beta-glucanosyltransferase [Penicillium malachiteum]KAJ5726239.1 1-3-beta-glucanosyltransferase [Penicillium malachiteum]